MNMAFDQKKYEQEFRKNNYVRVAFDLSKTKDADIIEFLQKQENKNALLKELIRKEMQRQNNS